MGSLGSRRIGMEGVTVSLKTSPPHVLPRPIWLFLFKEIDENPRNLGAVGLRPFGMSPWLTPKNKPPHHRCYHVMFGSSATKIEEPPKLGSAGAPPLQVGAWLSPKVRPSRAPHMCYHVKFGYFCVKVCTHK